MSRSGPRAGGRLAILGAVAYLVSGVTGVPSTAAADPKPLPDRGVLEPNGKPPRVTTALAAAAPGFQDLTVFSGLTNPVNIEFAPDGRIFIAEKRGRVQVFDSLTDPTPSTFVSFDAAVHDYWDRGFLGMALSPGFGPAGSSYLYVLYAWDHVPGTPRSATPAWNDACADPLGNGCAVGARLSRFPLLAGGAAGSEQVLIEDWCQQFPSHSIGDLAFGPDGFLYVSGGEGAGFTGLDFGQLGGNPCGDPTNEGGSLRSQSIRGRATVKSLDGAILRLDAAGNPAPGNPNAGSGDRNAQRIVAYGLRNPFRFTFRPGTTEIWVGDVGEDTTEEIDRLTAPSTALRNFGWPCYEGPSVHPGYDQADLPLCESLYAAGASAIAAPFYSYRHDAPVVPNEACPRQYGSVTSGIAFYAGGPYPAAYDGALFFADHSRRCIWAMRPATPGGLPSSANVETFVSDAAGPVDLKIGPGGDLFYVDFDGGTIHRVRSLAGNTAPRASAAGNPLAGVAPLEVRFDGSGSTDPDGPVTYDWDFGDRSAHSNAASPVHTFAAGTFIVKLTVTDDQGATDTDTLTVAASNSPPVPTIASPSAGLHWSVGQAIEFRGGATDADDGTLSAAALSWTLVMDHCTAVGACHAHNVQTWQGVSGGSFNAPDHDYPSRLEVRLTATDSKGVSTTTSVQLDPSTVDLTFTSSPPGASVTVGNATATTPFTRTVIVASRVTVVAPTQDIVGGQPTEFVSWSDGGARIHDITAPAIPASYQVRLNPADVGDTCATATPAAFGPWLADKIDVEGDIDWYRFSLPATAYAHVILGRLDTDLRLDLYASCSTVVAGAGRAGLGFESLYRRLPAGAYWLKVSGQPGAVSTQPYALRFRALSERVQVLSWSSWLAGGRTTIVGQVLNNTTAYRRAVTVRADLFNSANQVVGNVSVPIYASVLNPRTKAPFRLIFTPPTGYHHYRLTVSSTTTTLRSLPGLFITAGTRDLDLSGRLHLRGTLRNGNTYSIRSATVSVTLLDDLGSVENALLVAPLSRTLAPGARTTFEVVFPDHHLGFQAVEFRANAAR